MLNSLSGTVRRLFVEERAVALTEFALVAPLLFLLLFGVIDFGKAFNYWNDETQLAGQGARFAAVNSNPSGTLSLQQYIQAQSDSNELKNGGTASVPTSGKAKVCISFPNSTSQVGDPVQVTVSATYNWLSILHLSITQSTIQGKATMRLEAIPSNYAAGCST
jgi:Flp pilus assembly protein TadG